MRRRTPRVNARRRRSRYTPANLSPIGARDFANRVLVERRAAKYLAEAADLDPKPAETHLRLGLIASARNDWANAIMVEDGGLGEA